MAAMNKYMGFYELRSTGIPSVPWQQFEENTVLDGNLLWTIRVAVEGGNDLNLPRTVGVHADEAVQKGREFLKKYAGRGIVICYPYFIAQKSGVLDINSGRTIIEAVDRDLWNLVTDGKKNITAVFHTGSVGETPCRTDFGAAGHKNAQIIGDEAFLAMDEIEELLKYSTVLKGKFRGELSEGNSILAEWSYAYSTDAGHKPKGDRYLVFYELRVL